MHEHPGVGGGDKEEVSEVPPNVGNRHDSKHIPMLVHPINVFIEKRQFPWLPEHMMKVIIVGVVVELEAPVVISRRIQLSRSGDKLLAIMCSHHIVHPAEDVGDMAQECIHPIYIGVEFWVYH